MACRNGFVFVAAMICLGLMVLSVLGGSLDAPAAPTSSNSAMWTLNDIYNVLDTRATNVTKRAGAFVEPGGGPTIGTMHTLDNIMTLVTNRAPAPKSGQTTSYRTDDDGALEIGVAWPNPRFTVQADTNCVLDNLTGLIWARNANQFGATTWTNAVTSCNNLDYGGTNDWRLPNIRELLSLIAFQYFNPAICNTAGAGQWTADNPFTGVVNGYYWTSTTYKGNTDHALYVSIGRGDISNDDKIGAPAFYVWPVRGGR